MKIANIVYIVNLPFTILVGVFLNSHLNLVNPYLIMGILTMLLLSFTHSEAFGEHGARRFVSYLVVIAFWIPTLALYLAGLLRNKHSIATV